MNEHQNIGYKASWHDDYLKWVCGFANAQGGVIFIGKDDDGKVVGVDDSKKLMENCIRLSKYIFFDKKGLFSFEAKR
jgi:ATP-dependent DNA helicase RecG